MSTIAEIKRGNQFYEICPVCGHTQWCCTNITDDGAVFIVCKRDTLKRNLPGLRYIKDSLKEKNSVYLVESLSGSQKVKQYVNTVKSTSQTNRLCDPELNKINSALLSMLSLSDTHRDYLFKCGISPELIKLNKITSYPEPTLYPKRWKLAQNLIEKFSDLSGFPGAYVKENEESQFWNLAGLGGIIFPISNIYGEIVMLQIRVDNPPPGGGKYYPISSYNKKAGSSPGSRIGIVVPMVVKDYYVCYITEGIKKAIVGSEKLGAIFITVQGVGSWSEILEKTSRGEYFLDAIQRLYGSKVFVVAYDNDKYRNEAVMRQQKEVITALRERNLVPALAEWDSWKGKGIDDMLLNGHRPMYFPAM